MRHVFISHSSDSTNKLNMFQDLDIIEYRTSTPPSLLFPRDCIDFIEVQLSSAVQYDPSAAQLRLAPLLTIGNQPGASTRAVAPSSPSQFTGSQKLSLNSEIDTHLKRRAQEHLISMEQELLRQLDELRVRVHVESGQASST